MASEREIAHCPQCGHLIYESHRRANSELAQCPGCGSEVALGVLRPKLEAVPAAAPAIAIPAAPVVPDEFVPTGFRLARDGNQLEITLGEPRSMKPLGFVAWLIVGVVTVILSIARHEGLGVWWPALIAAITLAVLIARSPLVTFRALNGVISVERQRRVRELTGVRRFHADATGKTAQLVAENADGTRTVVIDELAHHSDARWLADRLNRELQ